MKQARELGQVWAEGQFGHSTLSADFKKMRAACLDIRAFGAFIEAFCGNFRVDRITGHGHPPTHAIMPSQDITGNTTKGYADGRRIVMAFMWHCEK